MHDQLAATPDATLCDPEGTHEEEPAAGPTRRPEQQVKCLQLKPSLFAWKTLSRSWIKSVIQQEYRECKNIVNVRLNIEYVCLLVTSTCNSQLTVTTLDCSFGGTPLKTNETGQE